jgi:ATP-dependent RNA/DNA helicase IGHMBP2
VAPSNLAVDNLLEKLLAAGEKAIRLGHPARVLPELRQHTLDILVETHPNVRLANKLAREAYALRNQASKYTRAKPQPGARYAMRQEARELLADARKIESQVIERILDGAMMLMCHHDRVGSQLDRRSFLSNGALWMRPARAPSPAPGFRCSLPTGWCWPVTTSNCRRR